MDFITPLLEQLNYLTVMFLMFIESTFIPFPLKLLFHQPHTTPQPEN